MVDTADTAVETAVETADSRQGLCEELLSTGALYCATCRLVLEAPTWLTAAGTNMCNTCHHMGPQEHTGALPNPALDMILERLQLPCPYRARGCEQVLGYEHYRPHVGLCPYRRSCLVPHCMWGGRTRDLPMHLLDLHGDLVLREDQDGAFRMECPQGPLWKVYMMNTWHGRFLARVRRLRERLQVLLYNHDQTGEEEGHFVLQYPMDEHTVIQRRCKLVWEIDALIEPDSAYVTEVSLENKMEMSHLELVLKRKNDVLFAPPVLASLYNCFNCKTFIREWVRECKRGHMVCVDCLKEGHVCTTEGDRLGVPHVNISLLPKGEDLDCLFPCKYQTLGCRFNGKLTLKHELMCDFRRYLCPVKDCPCPQSTRDLLQHMRLFHRTSIFVGRSHLFVNDGTKQQTKLVRYVWCYEKLFSHQFTYTLDKEEKKKFEWCVDIESDEMEDETMFHFAVDIYNEAGTGKLILSTECGSSVTLEGDILVNQEDLIPPSVQYSLRIIKVPNQENVDE